VSGAWKAQERTVADWFGVCRNPLSGRNNVDDHGRRRLGDIVYSAAVVEVKRHKTISMINVPCVRDLARVARLPWALFEFKTGAPNVVKITVDHAHAEYIAQCLDVKWREEQAKREMSHGDA
jgi:hypothetical protein